jgi:hypothetical protein
VAQKVFNLTATRSMQPGPFSSVGVAVLLAVASFWTGSVVHRPNITQAEPALVRTSEPAARKSRRRRTTTTSAPPPAKEVPLTGVAQRRKRSRKRASDSASPASEHSLVALIIVAVVSVVGGGYASQRFQAASTAEPVLRDLAPHFGNDGAVSPPRSVARTVPLVPEPQLGSVGDSSLLAQLARREVRQ